MLLKFIREKSKEIPNQIVEFKIGEQLFGIEVSKVVEIINLKNFSTVPESDSFLKGIVNLRGHILPIVDVRQKFQIPAGDIGKLSRAIILSHYDLNFGFLVDGTKYSLRNTFGAKVKERPYPSELYQLILEVENQEIPIINSEKLFDLEEIKRLENLKNTF